MKRTGKKSTKASSARASASGSPMDVGMLEQLVKLMASNDLNTVDVRDGDRRVVLKRGAPVSPVTYAAPVHHAAPQPAAASRSESSSSATPQAAIPAADDTAGLHAIKSPMVGTFYAAGSPDAKPFVSVGTVVDEDTDVCIIEAMKVFNNIKAETRGTVAKVLVTNGQTVEFGQTLFLVKA
jgi:acetyl-CoA carboxylase biotin carboxyl carrier protein